MYIGLVIKDGNQAIEAQVEATAQEISRGGSSLVPLGDSFIDIGGLVLSFDTK